MLHAVARETVYRGQLGMSLYEWAALRTFESLTRVAVPLFFMISGFLIIRKVGLRGKRTDILIRALKLILIAIAWTMVYSQWEYFKGEQTSLRSFAIATLHGKPYYHLWFLFALAELYLLAPILIIPISWIERKYYTILGVTIPMAWATLVCTLGLSQSIPVQSVTYATYFVSGYFLGNGDLPSYFRTLRTAYASAFAALVFLNLFRDALPSIVTPLANFHAHNPIVVVMSVAFFKMASYVTVQLPKSLQLVATNSMGVYILHPFALDIFNALELRGRWPTAYLAIPTLTTLVVVCALVSTVVAKKSLLRSLLT
jgi:surface polysaccharide O-acyltransferase-like enzyme